MNKVGILVLFGIGLWTGQHLMAQQITVTGTWTLTITEANLQNGPGSDLTDTYVSNANQVYVSIQKSGVGWFTNWYWRVDVRKSDSHWHGNFHLDVLRSGNGFGFGTITGGTSYREITDVDQSFFSGSRHRILIGLQYRLRGVSVQIPTDTYTTTVIYTVVEL